VTGAARLTLQHFENFDKGIDADDYAKPNPREKRLSLPGDIYAP